MAAVPGMSDTRLVCVNAVLWSCADATEAGPTATPVTTSSPAARPATPRLLGCLTVPSQLRRPLGRHPAETAADRERFEAGLGRVLHQASYSTPRTGCSGMGCG